MNRHARPSEPCTELFHKLQMTLVEAIQSPAKFGSSDNHAPAVYIRKLPLQKDPSWDPELSFPLFC